MDEKEIESPNTLWMPTSWRRFRDPWDAGKVKDIGRGAVGPIPVDLVGREYAEANFGSQIECEDFQRRDALIESIMEIDRLRLESVKRLILDDSRLDVLMKLLGYQAPAHQIILNDFLRQFQFAMALAPRGSGKSTSCDISYGIMRSLQNRDIRILLASRTSDQAQSFLGEIKGNLEKESLVEIFGRCRGDKWDEREADIFGRKTSAKEHTFTIAGADGAVVSKHFDLIIADDLVEEKNSRTEGQRNQLLKFFYKSLLPCLEPDGEMRLLGTRYHPEDLYGYLKENDPEFSKSIFVMPAVFDKETGEAVDLDQNEKTGKFEPPDNATCWDPIGFPMEKIIRRRASMPLADFECQYQNRTQFMSGDYFKNEWFQYYDGDPHTLARQLDLSLWTGVDLAASQKDDADEFAIVTIGVTPSMSEIYVLETFSDKLTFNKQKQFVLDKFDLWDPVRTFIEANAYQVVLAATTVEEFPDVRARPVWTTKDKVTRARALQLYYERRQVYHRKNRMSQLEGQLIGFPNVKLKDLFDALFFAVSGALQGRARKKRSEEEEFGLF